MSQRNSADAKTYLRRLRWISRDITSKEELLQKWRTRATSVTVRLDPNKVKGGGSTSAEDLLVAMADLEIELQEQIRESVEDEKQALVLIGKLEDERYREILLQRYFLGRTWREIAEAIGYDERHVTRLHGYALQELQKELDHE